MFWKIVKGIMRKRGSITTRLAAWFTFALLCLVLLIGSLQYFSLVNTLNKAGHEFVLDEASVLTSILLNEPDDIEAIQQEVVWSPAPNKYRKDRAFFHYVRLLDSKGHLIMESPGMQEHLPAKVFPLPVKQSDVPSTLSKYHSPQGNYYWVLSIKAKLGDSDDVRIVQIALDITYQQRVLEEFLYRLFSYSLLATLLAAFVGALIARHNMKQLKTLTDTARLITVNDLHQRINPESWPQELSRLAEAFNAMLDRIENAFSRLSQFSADLAHELRTPFNNLMGEAEIALSRQRSAEEYKAVIESSLEEYQRLAQMVESMLFLARAQDPQTDMQLEKTELQPLLETIIDFHEPIAAEKNIQVRLSGQGTVRADVSLLRRAVTNLVSNALQYTPENGCIDVHVQTHLTHVEIHIKDTGIGIPREHLGRVFDRFYRVDAARSQHSGGTGLGLAIVDSIMKLHAGAVAIESEPGIYTNTVLTFPAVS